MNESEDRIKDCIKEVILLSLFKAFCEKNDSSDARQKIRNIYSRSTNPEVTTKNLINNILQEEITSDEANRLYPMIIAFINKSSYRKTISDSIKNSLLKKQNYKCAICGKDIDIHSHADHTIPFKYVGDELKDNFQMLCSQCNLKKNASIDFQMRFLLKSV